MSSKTIFICGTDTGVGKTIITAALCLSTQKRGIPTGVFKPFESGCMTQNKRGHHHLKRADATFLRKISQMPEPLDWINPYFFKEALAPGVAACLEHKKISFGLIKNRLALLKKKYDLILIEGAGGLLVPLTKLKTNLDLIKELKASVILVARLDLGTINHTLLTLEHLKRNRIKTLGVILNNQNPQKNIAKKTNPKVLKKYGIHLLGIFPFIKNISPQNLINGMNPRASPGLKIPWQITGF